uniref:Uncharacterized protein n=1 Tax=Anguilla anguilla TaxID=7936 RepID=A0A0E9W6N2_ANGAN
MCQPETLERSSLLSPWRGSGQFLVRGPVGRSIAVLKERQSVKCVFVFICTFWPPGLSLLLGLLNPSFTRHKISYTCVGSSFLTVRTSPALSQV